MDISPTWAIALTAAAALAAVIAAAVRVDGRGHWLGRTAYLLGGGLAGFLALAFPPAWPLLAFDGTLLIGMALRDRRRADVALLMTGFGATWTLLLGLEILNDLLDAAVSGSTDTMAWFLGGSAVLVVGLVVLIFETARERPL